MRNGTSSRLRALVIAALLAFLTMGCGVAVHYDPPTATEESLAAARQSEAEKNRYSSSLTGSHDELSHERQRWSKLTKEGRTQLRMGNLGAAEQNYLAAAEIARSFRKSDRRRHAGLGNMRRLAHAHKEQGQDLAFARVAEVIRADTQGESEIEIPGLTLLLIELGRTYIAQDALDQAQVVLAEALALRIQREGAGSTSLIEIYGPMAHVAYLQEDYDSALALSRNRLSLAEQEGGDKGVISAQLQLAQVLAAREEFEEAEVLFDRALKSRQSLGSEPAETAIIQNALAGIYLEMDRLSLAQKSIDEALATAKTLGISGIFLASLIDTNAQVLAARGKPKQADREFKRALEEAQEGSKNQRVDLLENYSAFLKARDRDKEVSAIQTQIDELNADIEAKQSQMRGLLESPNPAATP